MADKPKSRDVKLNEGTLRKGGVNPEYKIPHRPAPPAPMKPSPPTPKTVTSKPKKG